MKVIIAGSRTFNDYDTLRQICDQILFGVDQGLIVISGAADGADRLGERYAKEKQYELLSMPADWKLGKAAGPIRNRAMADVADAAIVFWDGVSRGAKDMIETMQRKGKRFWVVRIDTPRPPAQEARDE